MSGDAYFRWWRVSIVDKASGVPIKPDIDAVLSKTTSSAIELAKARNPCKPNEAFAVSTATGKMRDTCRQINFDRTTEIKQFEELMKE